MPTFFTPPGYTGVAELTASNGLDIVETGLWRFSQAGYNDGATFGVSLTFPNPTAGGTLKVEATNWNIAVIGNALTDYIGDDSVFYPASQCRITVVGQWNVVRQQNSNSFNSFGVNYAGHTHTDLGNRNNCLTYQSPMATYVIQGADVDGGAQDTFSSHQFYCHVTELTNSPNSNKEYQSNTITRPVFIYTYTKSWQTMP